MSSFYSADNKKRGFVKISKWEQSRTRSSSPTIRKAPGAPRKPRKQAVARALFNTPEIPKNLRFAIVLNNGLQTAIKLLSEDNQADALIGLKKMQEFAACQQERLLKEESPIKQEPSNTD